MCSPSGVVIALNPQHEQFWLLTAAEIRSDQSVEQWNILELQNFPFSFPLFFVVLSSLFCILCLTMEEKKAQRWVRISSLCDRNTGWAEALQWCRFLLPNRPSHRRWGGILLLWLCTHHPLATSARYCWKF